MLQCVYTALGRKGAGENISKEQIDLSHSSNGPFFVCVIYFFLQIQSSIVSEQFLIKINEDSICLEFN